MNRFDHALQSLSDQGRRRSLSPAQGIDFTSNDYLGMRNHPVLRQTAIDALHDDIAIGSGGSRLLRGHSDVFERLETTAAQLFNTPRALYVANGYMANSAIFQALPNRNDIIIYDALVHASMREGITNNAAKSIKFKHNDLNDLERILCDTSKTRKADAMIWIACETLYSMDGDRAPITDIMVLSNKYDAVCIVDAAHDTGICTTPIVSENIITLHTCGKAVGVAGGIICASDWVINTLINTARPFIYSTAPPPLQALLSETSLKILYGAEGDKKREDLQKRIHIMGTDTHIMPVMIGADNDAVRVSGALRDRGYDIRAIRPPTVPKGTARLRITISTNQSEDTLKQLRDILKELLI